MADIKKFLDQQGVSTLWSAIKTNLNAEIARAKAAEEANANKIATHDTKISTMEGQIAALEAGTYDDTEVRKLISDETSRAQAAEKTNADGVKANAEAIDVLNGSGAGSVTKTVNDAINKFATDVSDDGVVNSYKELIDWVATHGPEAAEMAGAIDTLEAILDGIGDTNNGEKTTVVAYVDAAIAALQIGDYAKAADLTALADRVAALEKVSHTHDNKTVLDGITSTKVAAWDAAEQNAKDYAKNYADSLASNYDAAGSAADALASAKNYTDTQIIALTTEEINTIINS